MKQKSESRIELLEESLDLKSFVKRIWKERIFIIRTCSIFVILGLVFLIVTPNTYESKTVFLSQEDELDASGALGGLASFAGINLGSISSESQIPPKLYPGIVFSSPFLVDLLGAPVIYEGKNILYKEYLEFRSEELSERIKDYTIRLPSKVLKSFRGSNLSGNEEIGGTAILRLSDREFELVEELEDYISISVNDKDGDISLVFKDKDPFVAAQMASYSKNLLQDKLIDYKTKKASELYDYLSAQFLEKQRALYQMQDSLAIFMEENKNLSSELIQNKRLRLESSLNMFSQVYNELGAQKEQAALQLKKQTPIFSIIEPVRVPNRKSSPRLSIILVVSGIIGLVFAFGYILLKEPLLELKSYLQK